MTDVPPPDASPVPPEPARPREPFPATRLLYSVGFAFVAWAVFWLILVLGLLQFIIVAVQGHRNEDVRNCALGLVEYLWQLLAYISFGRDEEPFPLGNFPKPRA
jgi:hypothetical protein